jgi:adenine-specific DNA-methyltransferase
MSQTPEKLDLASLDVAADKQRQLRQLFPEVFTETTDEQGADRLTLDFDKLKAVLGDHTPLTAPGQERYGLDWPGKRDALRAVQASSYGTLLPAPEESVDWETTRNVFIEGDNLEVLKLLQKSYYGKVKMIYIDPPYNTGNDFVYPDNYAESLETYLRYTGKIDGQGVKTTTNSKDSGRFHSNWLRMMYPRLYVAKNLLRENGVLFISIDDNEVTNLRQLCDLIFGEDNFIEMIIWKKRNTPPNDKVIGAQHDYILIYGKSEEVRLNLRKRSEKQLERYENPDNHPKGPWAAGDISANVKGGRYVDSLYYPIINPKTGESHFPPAKGNWRFSRERVERMIAANEIYFGPDGKGRPKVKRFLKEIKDGITWTTLWDFVPMNTSSSLEMNEIFGESTMFENPKPIGLIEELLRLGSEQDSLIVDFFAGSCTTAHAAMRLNAVDGGRRSVLSVQLPEPCPSDREAAKAGFVTIADLSKERIRRAGKMILSEWELRHAGLESGTGQSKVKKASDLFADSTVAADPNQQPSTISDLPSHPPDTGFRVFKLAPSNFKRWNGEAAAASSQALVEQLEASLDHIATGATEESLLFEILLKAGYELTCPMEKLNLADQTVYAIDGLSLFISVADRIDSALIDAVAERHPVQFICLDRALQGNDSLKVNTLETFRSAQPEIQFRTV